MWTYHIKLIVDNNYGDEITDIPPDFSLKCGLCSKHVNDRIYQVKFDTKNLYFCDNCYNNELYNSFKPIDRTNFSIKEKPLKFYCFVCSTKLGGGHKWFFNESLNIDCCTKCYQDKSNSFYGHLFDFNDKNRKFLINAYYDDELPCIIDINLNAINFVIPKQLDKLITEDRNKEFVDTCFIYIVNNNLYSPVNEWTLFTDVTEMTDYMAMTGLIVNIFDPKHPVGSLLADNHGRCSVDKIYDSYDEYLVEYNIWESTRPRNVDEIKKKIKEFYEKNYSYDQTLIMEGSTVFSEYIRLKKNLSFYYG